MTEHPDPSFSASCEHGFTLLDTLIAIAIFAGILLFATSAYGMRAPATHPAALALEAALAEARSVATMQQADGTDMGLPTGATVSVAPDSRDVTHSIITVFASRPIANPDQSINGQRPETNPLPPASGFPPQNVAATFSLAQGSSKIGGGFTIMISSSGYTSIEPKAWRNGDAPFAAPDPGCDDTGVMITASSNGSDEPHPFDCRNSTYQASRASPGAHGAGS